MRIMTSNIWGNFFNNPPELREEMLYRIYKKYNPDVIGFQEAAQGWYDVELFQKLSSEYNLIGTAYSNNTNSTPIAIKHEYKVISYGYEQLENTPDVSKAITWAVLEKDAKRYAVCNTHFWWMRGTEPDELKKFLGVYDYTFEDHCELRSRNAEQLSELMKHLYKKYSCPVFAIGDMNATVTEGLFEVFDRNEIKHFYYLTQNRDNVCSVHADPIKGDDGFFHSEPATREFIKDFRENVLFLSPDETDDFHLTSIDHILGLGDNFDVLQYRVIEEDDAVNASDHSPVYVDVNITQ